MTFNKNDLTLAELIDLIQNQNVILKQRLSSSHAPEALDFKLTLDEIRTDAHVWCAETVRRATKKTYIRYIPLDRSDALQPGAVLSADKQAEYIDALVRA